ncbi:hypothetical protein [Streptomyces sp. 8N706]|uniref:hypothetical protein n=1 Tax=Streptomyces sp. 8N706 TaxID=3457416 RepID=UPI003FD235E6
MAVGAVGAFAAARAQVAAARAQADAMLEQADATYRAALDQARLERRSAHEQWQRGLRRDACAAFSAALVEVERRVARAELLADDDTLTSGALGSAIRALDGSRAGVELEGPGVLAAGAANACARAEAAAGLALQLAPRAGAQRAMDLATSTASDTERGNPDSPGGRALAAHREFVRLREAVHRLRTGALGQEGYAAARDRTAASFEAAGFLTPQQSRALLSDPSGDAALQIGHQHALALERLAEARTAFVAAARDCLDVLQSGD